MNGCPNLAPPLTPLSMPAQSFQLCPTLHDPMDCSLPGSSVHGISQARILEWGAISFSNAWKWKVKVKSLSRVRLFTTPWTVAYQARLSMGFSRQEYCSGLPLPSPLSPRVCSNSYPLNQWCYPTISSSAAPFSFCLQSFQATRSFLMSWIFESGGHGIGASPLASVLPRNIQG